MPSKMISPQDAINQKLMLAFEGISVPKEISSALRERPIAGFTLFRALNVESADQIRALTDELQKISSDNLLIGSDQEGGQLIAMGDDTTPFPGNMALAATGDLDLVEQMGAALGTGAQGPGLERQLFSLL